MKQSYKIGVAQAQIAVDAPLVTVPSLATLTFSACANTPTSSLAQDGRTNLSASDTYQIVLGLVGRDATNGGYSVSRCSHSSGNIVVTAGQGIQVKVVNTDWPASYNGSIAVAIFIKVNSQDFQLAKCAYLDTGNDFVSTVLVKPLPAVVQIPVATLQSVTTSNELGDRTPIGVTWLPLTPTEGGVTVTRNVTNVNVNPDTQAAFDVATTRSTNISFQLLLNEIVDVIRGNAGVYIEQTSGGHTIYEGEMALNTASAILSGNKAIKLFMPLSGDGTQEVRLLLGNLQQNQQANTENWKKDGTTTIGFNFTAAAQDYLLVNVPTEALYRFKS